MSRLLARFARCVAALLVALLLVGALPAVAGAAGETLVITPSAGPGGATDVSFTGAGWPKDRKADQRVEIHFGGALVSQCETGKSGPSEGHLTTCTPSSFNVPNLDPGTYDFVAVDPLDAAKTDSATFTNAPTISLSSGSGAAGAAITVGGQGFRPDAAIELLFDGALRTPSSPCNANAMGTFAGCVITAPQGSGGSKPVTARDVAETGPQRSATANWTLQLTVGSVTLGSTSGHWGSVVSLTGSGWPVNRTAAAGSGIEIRLGTTLQTRCGTTSGGLLQSCSFFAPDWAPGAYVLRATDPANEFNTSTATNGQYLIKAPSITLTPDSGPGGRTVTVVGGGFRAGSPVELLVDGNVVTPLVPCTTDAAGKLGGCQISIPPAARGEKTVIARDLPLDGQRSASATYTVDFPQGTVTLNPTSGPTGTTVSVTGSGWSYDPAIVNGVDITMAGQTVTTCLTASNGTLSGCSFKVPAVNGGAYPVEADDAGNPFNSAATSFSVSNRAIALSPTTGFSGSTVTISGAGFRANRSLEVLFGGTTMATTGTCASDAWGAFSGCKFTVPAAPAGATTVIVRDGTDGASRSSQASYAVEVAGAITLSASVGAAGTTIGVTGSGWTANRSALNGTVIEMGGEEVTTCATDGTGALVSCSFRVPPQTQGLRAVDATDGLNPFNVASRSFTVLAPTLSLSSAAGASGAAVTASGTGFRANSSVRIEFDNMLATTCAADAWGAFSSCQLTVPGVASKGVKTVRALDLPSGVLQRTAQTTYDVQTTVALTPPRGVPGSSFTVSGEGFNATETVELRWGPSSTVLGTCTTNSAGSFGGCTHSVANGTPEGPYLITASEITGPGALRRSAAATFAVVLPASMVVEPATATYGDTAALAATLTSGGVAVSGRDVTFRLNGTVVGTATTNGSGVATLPEAGVLGISAGTHPNGVHASFGGDESYTSAANTAALDIARREVTGSFTANNKIYNGTADAVIATRSLTNTVAGDVVSLSGGTAVFDDETAGSGKTVTATGFVLAGTAKDNYTLASSTLTATAAVSQKALVASFSAQNRTYNGTASAAITATSLTGVVAGDAVGITGASASFASKNAGVGRTVTFTGYSLSGVDAGNYSVNLTASAAATIFQAPLTITATAQSRLYDGTTTAVGVVLGSNQIVGDQLTLSHSNATFASKDVGNGKTVTVSGLAVSGPDATNYTLANANQATTTTANITPAAVTGEFTVAPKTYDGTKTATIATRSITGGVVPGETVTLTGGTAMFATKNVGSDIAVTGTGFTLGGADAANYSVGSIATTTGDITAKTVTATFGAKDKTYNRSTTAEITTRSVQGAVAGETLTLVGGTANFADRNVGQDKVVSGSGFTLGGTTAANYELQLPLPDTAADIDPRTVTGAFTADDKMYNGNTVATIATRSITGGVFNGDTVTLAGGSASFDTADVGDDKLVTGTGFFTSGPDGANYVLPATPPLTTRANITPADGLVVTFGAADRAYNRGTDAEIIPDSVELHGLEDHPDADVSLDLSEATATFDDSTVGTDKVVTLDGLKLTGADADAGNFRLSSAAPTTTATITPKSIAGSFTADGKPYDGTTAATIATRALQGVETDDDVTLNGGLATFVSPLAGTQTVTADLASFQLAGADAHNYVLDSVADTSAAVSKVPLTITAADRDMIWGQPAPAFASTYSGFIGGESEAVLGGTLRHTIRSSSGTVVTVGRSTPAGVYTITPSGLTATNYQITYVAGELNIGFLAGAGSYKPDGLVSARQRSGYLGNGVYNSTGRRQTESARVERGRQRTFYVKLQNDGGDLDTFTVRHVTSTARGFSVRYYQGTTDVTRRVKRGTFAVSGVAGGKARLLRMVVAVGSRTAAGRTNIAGVRITSSGRPTASDTVRAAVTSTR